MRTAIIRRLTALEAIPTDDDAPAAAIAFRVFTTDSEGRRTYHAPDADDLAAAARYAPKGMYHGDDDD